MDTTRDPESMTADERRDEIAGILARGLVRTVRLARSAAASHVEEVCESSANGLDPGADLPLSVAPRPAGSRAGL